MILYQDHVLRMFDIPPFASRECAGHRCLRPQSFGVKVWSTGLFSVIRQVISYSSLISQCPLRDSQAREHRIIRSPLPHISAKHLLPTHIILSFFAVLREPQLQSTKSPWSGCTSRCDLQRSLCSCSLGSILVLMPLRVNSPVRNRSIEPT